MDQHSGYQYAMYRVWGCVLELKEMVLELAVDLGNRLNRQ